MTVTGLEHNTHKPYLARSRSSLIISQISAGIQKVCKTFREPPCWLVLSINLVVMVVAYNIMGLLWFSLSAEFQEFGDRFIHNSGLYYTTLPDQRFARIGQCGPMSKYSGWQCAASKLEFDDPLQIMEVVYAQTWLDSMLTNFIKSRKEAGRVFPNWLFLGLINLPEKNWAFDCAITRQTSDPEQDANDPFNPWSPKLRVTYPNLSTVMRLGKIANKHLPGLSVNTPRSFFPDTDPLWPDYVIPDDKMLEKLSPRYMANTFYLACYAETAHESISADVAERIMPETMYMAPLYQRLKFALRYTSVFSGYDLFGS